MPKARKAELSFLYLTRRLVLFYISTKYHQNIAMGIRVTERTSNQFQKQEAHGPQLAHLSETAPADIQMACNIFLILLWQGNGLNSFWDILLTRLKCRNFQNVTSKKKHSDIFQKSFVFFFVFFFFFFWFGFYGPFKNISLISSRSFIEGGRKPEYPEKNHLTIRKQNLAFPHMTRARLEPQRWET